MRETVHFVNDGRGWECKRCRAEDSKARQEEASDSANDDANEGVNEGVRSSRNLARFFREGEAEEREPRLSSSSLARWKDDSRRALVCARCGAEESLPR